jgi:hypothetical protein
MGNTGAPIRRFTVVPLNNPVEPTNEPAPKKIPEPSKEPEKVDEPAE